MLATGESHSVREFVEKAYACIDISIDWKGTDIDEIGLDAKTGNALVKIDPKYFRPAEVDELCGDASKAKEILAWEHKTTFDQLIHEMVESDIGVFTNDVARR